MTLLRQLRRRVLRLFAIVDRPAAWLLMLGAGVTFFGVLVGWITVGDFRFGTLLIAADLLVSGFSAVQEAENESDDDLSTIECPACGAPRTFSTVRSFTLNGETRAEIAVDDCPNCGGS